MEYITTEVLIKQFWEALNRPVPRPSLDIAERIFLRSLKKGWVFSADVDDILEYLDNRLSYQVDISEFTELIGLRWERIYYKPKSHENQGCAFSAIRPEDMCSLLIALEQFGFNIDATPFVNTLLPSIKSKQRLLIRESEFDIFYYNKVKNRWKPSTFVINKEWWRHQFDEEKIKSPTGFKIILYKDRNGVPIALEITPSKYRRRSTPIPETCPDCGYEWHRGDTSSSHSHRKEHKWRMSILDPQPLKEWHLEEKLSDIDPELVVTNSPKWQHQQMYDRAKFFKREFGYDFIQWPHPKNECSISANGYLLRGSMGQIIGACSFFNHAPNNSQAEWGLQWVWICPKERRNGHLSKRWNKFRELYGDFTVESPVSDAMQSFLIKRNESHLILSPKER